MHLKSNKFADVVKNTPLVAIDFFIIKDRKLLIGKRMNSPGINKYFVPGGRIKKNENIKQALDRILFNETNMRLRKTEYAKFQGIDEHFYKDNFLNNTKFDTHYVVLLFSIKYKKLKLLDGAISLKNQHKDFIWVNKTESKDLKKEMNKYMKSYLKRKFLYSMIG